MMFIRRITHERILAEGRAAAAEVIAKANEDRDSYKIKWLRESAEHVSSCIRSGERKREIDRLTAALDEAHAILDTAYVRGPKGRMQRYRAETEA